MACQAEQTQQAAEKPAPNKLDYAASSAERLTRRFDSVIVGAWVKSDYLDAVAARHSTFAAHSEASGITVLHINPANRVGDSLEIGAGYNNHEGYPMKLGYKPGHNPHSLETTYTDGEPAGSFDELGYHIFANDTTLLLSKYAPDKRLLSTTRFRRVLRHLPTADNLELGLSHAVNTLLFAGTFAGTDFAGRAARLQFTADGYVRGIPGVHTYQVQTDFAVSIENNLDHIFLDIYEKRQQRLAYTFRADSLYLHETKTVLGTDSISELQNARLLYRLVRLDEP